MTVFAINGGPLYYYDSVDYLSRGAQVLSVAGVPAAQAVSPLQHGHSGPVPLAAAREKGRGDEPKANVKTADVSRSVLYAVWVGLFASAHVLEGVLLLNGVIAVMCVWLPIHIALRTTDEAGERMSLFGEAVLDEGPLTFTAVMLAVLGSLSFYVAFLMPDIFTPVLLLIAATLTAYAGQMTRGELVLCVLVGALATMAHTSHLLIALAMVPPVLAGALLLGGERRWVAPVPDGSDCLNRHRST